MKNKITSAFEQIAKKSKVDSLVGKLTTLCSASIQCDKFDFIVDNIDNHFDFLLSTFSDEE